MTKTWGPHNSNIQKARAARKAKQEARKRSREVSEREKVFAQGIVAGLSRTAALRKAGYGQGTVNADEILDRQPVVKYMRELHGRAIQRLDYSVDNLCARLEHIAYEAMDHKQYGPAVTAVMGIAKMMGHLMDKSEVEMHIISKPAREPTKEVELSPEEWQRQFAPKAIN